MVMYKRTEENREKIFCTFTQDAFRHCLGPHFVFAFSFNYVGHQVIMDVPGMCIISGKWPEIP